MDLDDQQGYIDVNSNPLFQALLAELDPEETQDGYLAQRASHMKRGGLRDFGNAIFPGLGDVLESGKDLIKPVFDKVADWTTIGGSFDRNVRIQFPDPSRKSSGGNTPRDKSITPKDSPWGKALRLKRVTNDKEYAETKGGSGYVDMFRVGCGIKGSFGIAGRAKWSLKGFSEGKVDLTAFLDIIMKLGIVGKTTGKQTFESTIFEQGLPGLTFGPVFIGPRVSLGYRTEITAAAKGQVLAGAKMEIEKGITTLDFVRPDISSSKGWKPFFEPELKASGTVQVSAELGLPVSLQCGLKIAGVLDKSVGITDIPSIKATVQASASIG